MVTPSTVYPAALARAIAASAMGRPPGTYNWYQSGPAVAARTSSIRVPENVDRMNAVPAACAARAACASPDVSYHELPGVPHYFEGHRREAMEITASWLKARFP